MKIDRRPWQWSCLAALSVISNLGNPPEIAAAEAVNDRELVDLIVVARDTGKRLPSTFVTFPPSEGVLIGRTREEDGVFTLPLDDCATRVQARPLDAIYEYSVDVFCRDIGTSPREFRVTPIRVANSVRERLAEAQETNDLGSAAYLANELRWTRSRDGQGVAGEEAEQLVYEYVSQVLGTNSAAGLDPTQGRVVMDPELRQAVVEFQRDEGLSVDGIVGPETLRAISRKTLKTVGDVFD